MARRPDSPRTTRTVGALLAVIWLGAGVWAGIIGAVTGQWLLVPLGAFAVWYGIAWLNVARFGRRLTLREALKPWRIERRPDADA